MYEEHLKPFTLPPPFPDCILTLLPQQPSAEDTHTRVYKCAHINTKLVAHTKQVFILSDVSMLSMFLHLCVCVCVCAPWYFLSWAGYQPQT